MIVPEQLVQQLVETLTAINLHLARPTAGEERFFTVEQLCARWGMSRFNFYKSGLAKQLVYCEVKAGGFARYPLSVVVAHETKQMRKPDGTALHETVPEKRPARRRGPTPPQPELRIDGKQAA
jgi:hypothetical protein